MDQPDYHDKMKSMLKDRDTYEIVKPPFRTVERELNTQLPQLKNEQKLNYHTYTKLQSTNGTPHSIRDSIQLGSILLTLLTSKGSRGSILLITLLTSKTTLLM
jgi:hypothetical protein